jgi:hypothetical protein
MRRNEITLDPKTSWEGNKNPKKRKKTKNEIILRSDILSFGVPKSY